MARLDQSPVKGGLYVMLQPDLLVIADSQIGQQHQFRPFFGVLRERSSPVVIKCLSKEVLTLWRPSNSELGRKGFHFRTRYRLDIGELRQPTGELQSNLFEHLAIAVTYRLARAFQRTQVGNGIDYELEHVQIDLQKQVDQPSFETAYFPRLAEPLPQNVHQVLVADCDPGLSRRPGRKCAPVCVTRNPPRDLS